MPISHAPGGVMGEAWRAEEEDVQPQVQNNSRRLGPWMVILLTDTELSNPIVLALRLPDTPISAWLGGGFPPATY